MSVSERNVGTKGVPRQERERQILDAATVEFATRGYAAGTVEHVGRAVGVSRAMIHAYFGDKDELYAACLTRAGEPLVAVVAAAQDTAQAPVPRALATLRAILETLEDRRHDWPLLYDRSLPPTSSAYARARHYRTALERLGVEGTYAALEHARNAKPGDAELLSELWLELTSAIVRWWLAHPEESADSAVARLERIFADLL